MMLPLEGKDITPSGGGVSAPFFRHDGRPGSGQTASLPESATSSQTRAGTKQTLGDAGVAAGVF